MASHAQSYDNPSRTPSENLSPYQLKKLVRYSGIPAPQKELFLAALEISKGAGVLMWASVKSLAIETKRCERTIYRRLRRARRNLDLLTPVRDPGTWDSCPKCGTARDSRHCRKCSYEGTRREFRRSRTFQLNVKKIAEWPLNKGIIAGSYQEYKSSDAYPGNKKESTAGHRSPQRSPIQKPAAVPITRPHTMGGTRAEERTRRLRQDLGKRMAQLMAGTTRIGTRDGFAIRVGPGDPRYMAPMSQEEAMRAAAAEFGVTPEEVSEHLRLMHWKFASEEHRE